MSAIKKKNDNENKNTVDLSKHQMFSTSYTNMNFNYKSTLLNDKRRI